MLRGVGLVIAILRLGIRIRRGLFTHRIVSVWLMSLLALSPSMTFARNPAPDATTVTVPAETLAHWRSKAASLLDALQTDVGYQARQAQARSQAFASLGLPEASTANEKGAGGTARQSGTRLYVFVSSSMPLATLRRYAADLDRLAPTANVSLVLRGFIGGGSRMGPTVRFVHQVLRFDAECDRPDCPVRALDMQVDPLLFRRFAIERVPAVVFATDWESTGQCSEGTERGARIGGAHTMLGDASLRYHLERLAEVHYLPAALALAQRLEPHLEEQQP